MLPDRDQVIEHRPSQIAVDLAVWLVGAYGERAKEFRDFWAHAVLQHGQFVVSFGDYCFAGEDTFVPGDPELSNVHNGLRRAHLALVGMPDVTDEMIDAVIAQATRKRQSNENQ